MFQSLKMLTGETVELRFYEDMPNVAYIDIADYYHLYLPDKEMTVEESGKDTGIYTVVNATGSADLLQQQIPNTGRTTLQSCKDLKILRISRTGNYVLPFIMKDNGVLVMGEKSRGGSCAVQRLVTADGLICWMSSSRFRMTDKADNNIDGGVEPDVDLLEKNEDGSSKTVKIEIDSVQMFGVGPDSDTTTIEMSDYSEFYNIDRLSEEMNAFYN